MMKHTFQQILDWSEVWALLIPVTVLLLKKPKAAWVRPIKIYLILAFILNLLADVIWKRKRLGLYDWMQNNLPVFYNADGNFDNTLLYNLHSIIRFLLFAWFFSFMGRVFKKMNVLVIPSFLAMAAIVFIFYKDIREFSSLLLGTEAAILLVYCLVYYIILLRDEVIIKGEPSFWVVTGLSIYVVINFPIFLFYTVLAKQSRYFAVDIWDIHNLSYIVLCLFIAKAFYGRRK